MARAIAGTTRSARPRTPGAQLGDGDDLQQQQQDEADRAESADATVAHDRQPMLGVAPGQTVEAIGEPVEVQAAGQELPDRHGEQPGEQRGKEHRRRALRRRRGPRPIAQADYRKPDRGAADGTRAFRTHLPGRGTIVR